jgi:hypothetical protein
MPDKILNDRFRTRILRRYLGGVASQQNPQAVIVAGQPAAGKSVLIEELCLYFAQHGQSAVIDVDELDLLCGPAEPNRDPNQLAAELCSAAIDRRLHLLIATSLANFDLESARLGQLIAAGYQTALVALKVSAETSWSDLTARADRLRRAGLSHLPATREEHCQSINRFVQTLIRIEKNQLVDELYIIDRQGTSLATATPRASPSSAVSQAFSDLSDLFSPHHKPPLAPPPEVIQLSSGRKLKLGSFASAQSTLSLPTPSPPAEEPQSVAAQPPAKAVRGIKLGVFPQRPAVPDPPHPPPSSPTPPPAPPVVQPQRPNIAPPAATNEPSIRNPNPAAPDRPVSSPQPPPPLVIPDPPLPPPIDHSRQSPTENRDLARKRALQQKIRQRAGLD